MLRAPRRRTVVAAVLLGLVVWAGAVAYLLVDAANELEAGQDELDAVRHGATTSTLLDPDTGRAIDRAGDHFDRARSRVRSPVVTPLRVLPVVGRHVRALDRVVSTSQGAADLAGDAVTDLRALAERPLAAGPERLAVLEELAEVLGRTRAGLDALDPGSPDDLLGLLGDAVADLGEAQAEASTSLARADQAVGAVARVLEGPTPYLLLGANNAEMRAGSGMFLSATTLGFDRGALQLGEVRPSEEVVLPAGEVPVTGDVARNWPWIDGGRDLRSMGLTADFPQSAALAADNWSRVPGGAEVGGVLVVDVEAVRRLLEVVGPVEVDGVSYSAETVSYELLANQYARYGDDSGARRDQLGAVAEAVFERIEAGSWELDEMATALVEAVQGRHLLAWSADAEVQEALADAGADGHLRDDSLSVAMLNRAGTKVDYFLDTEAVVTSSAADGGRRAITLTYRITNRAPPDGPRYQLGPFVEGLAAGDHRGIVVVNLPVAATDVTLGGARQTLTGPDGPTVVVAGEVTVRRGETVEVTVDAVLPEGVDRLTLEPSARIPGTRWTVDGEVHEIDHRRTVSVAG